MTRHLLTLLCALALPGLAGTEPAFADQRTPATVVHGTPADAAPAFVPRSRVQSAAPGAGPPSAGVIVVVRGKAAEADATGRADADVGLVHALATLCQIDSRHPETLAVGLPGVLAIPARF